MRRGKFRFEPAVLIIALNAEKTIRRTLESVRNFEEIIVIDNGSVDNTVKIAKEYTDKAYTFKTESLKLLREHALTKSTKEWVFFIDTDEVLTKSNKGRLLQTFIKHKNRYDGFWLARRNYFGKGENDYLKHGLFYPDFQLRLFKKKYRYKNTPHEEPDIPLGQTHHCKDIEIYHYPRADVLFSIFGASRLLDTTRKHAMDLTNETVPRLLYNAIFKFYNMFFISLTRGKGILDGWRGIIAAFNFSTHVALIYLYAIYYKVTKKGN